MQKNVGRLVGQAEGQERGDPKSGLKLAFMAACARPALLFMSRVLEFLRGLPVGKVCRSGRSRYLKASGEFCCGGGCFFPNTTGCQ